MTLSLIGAASHFSIVKANSILIKPGIMKHPTVYRLSIIMSAFLSWTSFSYARPVDFNEVSLLVRARESESSIKNEVSRRKLARPLTTQQESTLKSQGASDSLVQSLRDSKLVASKEESASFEPARAQHASGVAREAAEMGGPKVFVFNAAFGHPINLSQWGGLSYEIAFYSYRCAGEDYIEPALIDNVRTGTEVIRTIPLISEGEAFSQDWYPRNEVRNWRFKPYDAHADLKDDRFNFSDAISASSYSVARTLRIDWDNPVFIDGQPYTFYPVYGAGGVSLYYICKASETSAKLAVVKYAR